MTAAAALLEGSKLELGLCHVQIQEYSEARVGKDGLRRPNFLES